MKNRVFLQNFSLNAITIPRLMDIMFSQHTLHSKLPIHVCYANIHSYITAKKDNQLIKALHTADIVYPDGWGIVLAAKFFNLSINSRMTAYDFFPQFLQKADNQRTSLYLLGGSKETIKKTAIMIKKQYPHIQIQGFHNGYIQTKQEELRIIREINQKKVNILLVGMGTPMQEIWTYKNKHTLNVKVIWCVGGLFDYLSGDMKHCPKWIGNIGFQWLWRLIHEPRRLWKRYLIELPQFFIYSIKAKFLS